MGVLNDIPFLTNHNGATRGVLIGSDVRTQRNAVRKTKTFNGYIGQFEFKFDKRPLIS